MFQTNKDWFFCMIYSSNFQKKLIRKMARKLSIVISEEMSLSGYEAGVMYDVLKAIATYNAQVTSDEQRIEVAVATDAVSGHPPLLNHLCNIESQKELHNSAPSNAREKKVSMHQLPHFRLSLKTVSSPC
ncbi:hypothetical protein V2H45_04650 [Tumidithrix elongata RA019]|uniref:Uncharacterized protein n=1 Tax=Tumidithrix elongata BACA0141 TaxID=2716417 RepID=A0AAW9PXP2_9CYAN|nr:hypothetical protein [Tumidithrix elongata RA019]